MKINYFGLAAAVFALASLGLSWFNVTMRAYNVPFKMQFTAYLYQIQGNVNGTQAAAFPNLWFVWGALAVMAAAAAACVGGTLLQKQKGPLLLLFAGILSMMAMVIFGAGLLSSSYAQSSLEPSSVLALFPQKTFGVTAHSAMQYGYDFAWNLSYGFWLAIGAAILAFAGAAAPALTTKKAAPYQAA